MQKHRARIAPPRPSRAASAAPADAWINPPTIDLFQTIVGLKTLEEAERFFRDLCTIPELQTLAHRWEVAKLLDQGVPYTEIAARTGASTATITRINTWRRYGTGGYQLLLDRRKAHPR